MPTALVQPELMMPHHLHIAATFLDQRYHGRGDGGEPEWPPSPLRLFQAIIAANGEHVGIDGLLDRALTWLEQQPPPLIIAPRHELGAAYCLSVPNNAMDLVAKAWSKGNYFGAGDSNPSTHRTMKTVRPLHLRDGDTVHYCWPLDDGMDAEATRALIGAARRMVALGWGIDLIAGNADTIEDSNLSSLSGERWSPTGNEAPTTLRIPVTGTCQALQDRHTAFTLRMGDDGLLPVAPLTKFTLTGYRRPTDPIGCPFAVFELRHDDGEICRYSQRRLIHLAGMVRHLAIEAMTASPPRDASDDWVDRYVAGHRPKGAADHRQLSYLPLPSIGHEHADQIVRRIMIAAPLGHDAWLEHLARRLAGQQLTPERGDEFDTAGPPSLIRVHHDKVARHYARRTERWASVTPVILPGHDDRKPAKTRKLIEASLAQAGIEQACDFDWSAYSRFRKSFSAHKYDKGRRPQGYFRPDHLQTQTAVHLTLHFKERVELPGPIAIGAGRHCGLGLFAPSPALS